MEGVWLRTKKPAYLKITRYWMKIFALTFGMGVVSGMVMAYELGTNFGDFTDAVGGVLGPLFSYEVMSAFFLEAGFLGIMLFGWNRVGPKLHYFATLMVTIGTVISAFWIIAANSWMQTPAGFHEVAGKFIVSNWWDAIFNPSFLHRYFHMLLASLNTSCFVIAGVSAYYLLKNKHLDIAKPAFSFALAAAMIFTPTQLIVGDMVGRLVQKHQPIKTAAIEAVWKTQRGAPLVLFAIPDSKKAKNLYAIEIPKGASLLNTHKLNGKLQGLTSVPAKDRPVVIPVFFAFRVMVGIGLLLFLTALFGLWQRMRKRLFKSKALQRLCIFVAPLGFIATIAGWITAEMGRQPWIVYNLMRTMKAASAVPALHVAISLGIFVVVYGIIFSFYLYYLFKLIRQGPKKLGEIPEMMMHFPDEVPH